MNEFVYLTDNVSHNADLFIEVNRSIVTHGAASGGAPSNYTTDRAFPSSSFRRCALELYDRPSVPPELKIRMLTLSVLVANSQKLLYTVANPACGLLNREKIKIKKSGSAPPAMLV